MKRKFLTLSVLCLALLLCACLVSCDLLDGLFGKKDDTPAATVTFIVDGKTYATRTVKADGSDLPGAPEKTGHRFVGWFADSAGSRAFDATSDTVAYAVYEACTYRITYLLSGGTTASPASYVYGTAFTVGSAERDGFDFVGWQSDLFPGKTYTAVNVPAGTTGDMTFTAVWKPNRFSITYINAGENSKNPLSYKPENLPLTLVAPEKDGYAFLGWTGGGIETPALSVSIPEGVTGDLTFEAHWSPVTYTITYDLGGGTADNPASYTVEDTFTLTAPTREGYAFTGWTGTDLTAPAVTVTLPRGSTGHRSYTATWEALPTDLTYGASAEGITVSYRKSGEETVLTAPGRVGNYRFVGWTLNGESVSASPVLRFGAGAGVRHFEAVYAAVTPFSYDKKTGADLAATLSSAVTSLRGGGATAEDHVLSGSTVTLRAAYLAGLAAGEYTYLVGTADGFCLLEVSVTDSRTPTDLYVEYDTEHFPAAVLRFACLCGGAHTCSVDGAAAFPCEDGMVLEGYDKSVSHTLRVTCASGGSAGCATEGWTADSRKFYETSFTFGGRTYDYVPDTEEELSALLYYLALVKGVEDCAAAGGSGTGNYEFWVDGAAADLCDSLTHTAETFSRILTVVSLPMSPSYTPGMISGSNLRFVSFAYRYGFNATASDHTRRTDTADRQGLLLTEPTRAADFADFAIAGNPALPVRTLYELETLPYGYRPTFDTSSALSARAAAVYDRACEILRGIVSDDMSDYEKVAAIYAWLALHVTYDHTAADAAEGSRYSAYTVEGALVHGLATCDGFGSAMRLLCQIEGIECVEITGLQEDGNDATGHAWNKVKIDGVWYGVDTTWAYQESAGLVHMAYLFMDEESLTAAGHYENARLGDARYTTRIAVSGFDWFDLAMSAPGLDRHVATAAELIAAAQNALAKGAEYVTVRVDDASVISDNAQALMEAVGASRMNTVRIGDGYCFIKFTF